MKNAFHSADILLPKFCGDSEKMSKWSVVACDQYTSEPDYWNDVNCLTQGAKTTLNMILPEIYLENSDVDCRIEKINSTMHEYLSDNVFDTYENTMLYIERTQSDGEVRQGIIGAIDLDEYDYSKGSKSQVRATEATVVERIPPRIKVRKNAALELPHIMILIDDPEKTIVERVGEKKQSEKPIYDFDLMKNGGHLKGWTICEDGQQKISEALDKLMEKDSFNAKYGLDNEEVLLFAMGDGNHSLATAKEFYESIKRENPEAAKNHPARYALVEIVNLHSSALKFEAIHRIVTGVNSKKLISDMKEKLGLSFEKANGQEFSYIINGTKKQAWITKPVSNLTVGSVQSFLDGYLKENGGKIDYIHGEDVVCSLTEQPDSIGFILPDMAKSELFPTVIKDGALPRKTFSMGHAADKRFYTECRKIR